jgi:hypothetical protein
VQRRAQRDRLSIETDPEAVGRPSPARSDRFLDAGPIGSAFPAEETMTSLKFKRVVKRAKPKPVLRQVETAHRLAPRRDGGTKASGCDRAGSPAHQPGFLNRFP